MIRTYRELILLPTFNERFEYLKLDGRVGVDTFGFDRIFNQMFYKSKEWRELRHYIIARDMYDLGVEGYSLKTSPIVHHMNPISIDDIREATDYLFNPDYLITTQLSTHNAIHYGDPNQIRIDPVIERKPFDTCPWR